MEEISSADKMIAYISIEVGRRYNSNKERARDLDVSEANASSFARFMSGLGMDVAIRIADAKFGGSIEADVGTVRNVRRSVYPGQSKKPLRK